MFRNYVKVALKVFWRHKFFTAVNLFGICFTLVVLMAAAAFIDQQTGPIPPEVHAGRTLYLGWLVVQHASAEPPGPVIGKPSYAFLDRYVRTLKTAEQVTVFSDVDHRGVHGGAEDVHVEVRMTDGAFWEVFRYDFRQGRPYTAEEVKAGDFVAVIGADFSRRSFGSEEVVGESVSIDGRNYRIVGVVADFLIRTRTLAEVWVPLTTAPSREWRTYKLNGDFNAAVLAPKPAHRERIRAEFAAVLKQVELPPHEHLTVVDISAPLLTTLEEWAREDRGAADFRTEDPQQAVVDRLRWRLLTLAGSALLFMLLPALHLVNLNMGRIEERTSEIGVRKSFGASTRTLVGQFVTENVLLTLLGGALSLPFSWAILAPFAVAGVAHIDTGVLARTFFYGVLLALFFGTVSGAYPAWRMARLHPVRALTGRER